MKYPVVYEGKEYIIEADSPEEAAAKVTLQPSATPQEVSPAPAGIQGRIRSFVESQPFPVRTAIEMAPSTAGYIGGSFLPGGPVTGALAGAGMETLAQKIGITPQSRLAQAAALLPAAAKPLGYAGQLGKKLLGASFLRFPGVRTAGNIVAAEAGEAEAKTALLALSRRGEMNDAYNRLAARADLQINPVDDFAATAGVLEDIGKELKGISMPMAQRVNSLRKQLSKSLGMVGKKGKLLDPATGKPVILPPEPINLNRALETRKELGRIVGQLEKAGQMPYGRSKQLYGAMFDDLEALAAKPGLTGETAELALRAASLAKREFAVDKLGSALAKAERTVPGQGLDTTWDAAQIIDKIRLWTDPAAKGTYDKNFASALKNELPDILKWLKKANERIAPGTGAQGGLVVAGRMAAAGERITGGIIGGLTGGLTQGGPLAAGVGALIGANAQTVIAELMLTPGGRKILDRALNAGGGKINDRFWGAALQGIGQGTVQIGRTGQILIEETIPRLFEEQE